MSVWYDVVYTKHSYFPNNDFHNGDNCLLSISVLVYLLVFIIVIQYPHFLSFWGYVALHSVNLRSIVSGNVCMETGLH